MPIILNYTLQISPFLGFILVYTHKHSISSILFGKALKSLSNQSQSCPKNERHSKKSVTYCLHILESTSIILSSSKMYLKAGSIYYVHLLLSMIIGLFLLMNLTILNL
ncbi:MAG: hypothetical protein B7C24_09905 [Bacteroidetes bacterium 4572_77]|nr:MAG: hypothetical protein B7C24_09905 [Bacteroidetes bacterium 4572_77]